MANLTLVRPNPALTRGFARVASAANTVETTGPTMTLQGTVDKTLALTILLLSAGIPGWFMSNSIGPLPFFVAIIGALITGLITTFKPAVAGTTAPIYALLEGFILGAISQLMNTAYPGIALTAAELTVGILVALLFIYSTGIIHVTQRFRIAVAAATFGVCVAFIINLVAMMFGGSLSFVSGDGAVGIGFSLLVIAIACANLIVDFDFVQRGVAANFPKYMEWYSAYAIMVTLIWLYLEILRLLSKLRSR